MIPHLIAAKPVTSASATPVFNPATGEQSAEVAAGGTAEIATGRAHSWFAGFAPYGGGAQRRIAFAVVIENAGYGARAAAPIAGDLVTAARELGVIH